MPSEEDLLDHLQVVTGLDRPLLAKVLDEVRTWFLLPLGEWVRKRHEELHRQGLQNREIYSRIQEEARRMLVRPQSLSLRQIRRIIYG